MPGRTYHTTFWSPKRLLVVVLTLVIIIYGYTHVRAFMAGPLIKVTSPRDGETVEDALVTMTGTANRISQISLNGRQIFTDEAGHFKEELLLAYGYNILELKAEDRFGRTVKETLRLVLN